MICDLWQLLTLYVFYLTCISACSITWCMLINKQHSIMYYRDRFVFLWNDKTTHNLQMITKLLIYILFLSSRRNCWWSQHGPNRCLLSNIFKPDVTSFISGCEHISSNSERHRNINVNKSIFMFLIINCLN